MWHVTLTQRLHNCNRRWAKKAANQQIARFIRKQKRYGVTEVKADRAVLKYLNSDSEHECGRKA